MSVVHDQTLDNGARIVLLQDDQASLCSVRVYVKAGSMMEGPHLGAGLSHFLEHMVAGGSTTIQTEEAYKKAIGKMGGAFNAHTTNDHTCYYINTTPDHVQDAVRVLSEWVFSCAFEPKEFNREREVITREIEKNTANIDVRFYHACQHNLYQYHPIQLPVIGYLDQFLTITRDDLMAYYRQWYVPNNMIVVIAGQFKSEVLLDTAIQTFGAAKPKALPLVPVFEEPQPFCARRKESFGPTNTTLISLRFATISLFSGDLYPLDLLEFILDNGHDSLLNRQLIEEKALAYTIHCASYTPTLTTGYFEISAEIDSDKEIEFVQATLAILDDIKAGKFDADRTQRAKKQKLAENIFAISTLEDRASKLGEALLYGRSPEFFEIYVEAFKHVTKDQVAAVAKTYLDPAKMIVTVLRPEDEKPSLDHPYQNTETEATKTPQKITLQNGIRVLLYPNKTQPKVHCKLAFLGGLRAETAHNNGIGSLTADLLGKGSAAYEKIALQTLIENNGAQLGGSMGNNTLMLAMDCLSDDFETLLPAFLDAGFYPVFSDTDLADSKRRLQQVIEQREDDWQTLAFYQARKQFFKAHPYGLSSIGELTSVDSITKADIDAYFASLLNPTQLVLTVFGDIDQHKIQSLIEQKIGAFEPHLKTRDGLAPLNRQRHNQASKSHFPIKQDVGAVLVAFDGTTFTDTEGCLQFDLLDSILSGLYYPSGRLHERLRGEGLVYMVHATHYPGLEAGHFLIYALTHPDRLQTVTDIIFEEIQKVQTTLIGADEFEKVQAEMDYYYREKLSSLESLSLTCITDELYGLGFDRYVSQPKQFLTLNPEKGRESANRYLQNPQVYWFSPTQEAL
ncbi:MAG: M16 family metallopeptidase [Candidatus Margulisiibacteriota bacterium]